MLVLLLHKLNIVMHTILPKTTIYMYSTESFVKEQYNDYSSSILSKYEFYSHLNCIIYVL